MRFTEDLQSKIPWEQEPTRNNNRCRSKAVGVASEEGQTVLRSLKGKYRQTRDLRSPMVTRSFTQVKPPLRCDRARSSR